MNALAYISSKTNYSEFSIQNTIKLLDEDCTVPFIARYRKEMTRSLDEVAIEEVKVLYKKFHDLEKRKETILKSIDEQGKLSDTLKSKIENTFDTNVLEDLYLPFKAKRKTKATIAIENGLEPLAKMIMAQNTDNVESLAQRFVKGAVESVDLALRGARNIIAEWMNERSDIRGRLRRQYERNAIISTKVVKGKDTEEQGQNFKDYFEFSEPLYKAPSHRILAILRAETLGIIRVKVTIDPIDAYDMMENRVLKGYSASTPHIVEAIKDAYKRLLHPSLSNEVLQLAKVKAEENSIKVFAKNLEQLLLQAPLGEKRILAIDPGFRTGCKVACLDNQGNFIKNTTIFPHEPQKKYKEAQLVIKEWVEKYAIQAIAIGNGTASRETEKLIRSISFTDKVEIFVVNEAGASIYSASEIAREEFPDLDITVRGAISIGRRLIDPLAELVKIDPKSIGVGQYQHDVNQKELQVALTHVVERCVNKVGVNVNTASVSLLQYVSGIGEKLAKNIVTYREQEGGFASRVALKKVPRLGGKAFEQSAGFLQVKNGTNPLDASFVHPENYTLVKDLVKSNHKKIHELIGTSKVKELDISDFKDVVGNVTLQDILKELEKPGLDPRDKAVAFEFDATINRMEDLTIGYELNGIVNNITNFGCFVDIGIKESGLIHISNLTDGFVSDVSAIVSLNQQVRVRVLEVDLGRKRVQLKLIG